MRTLLPLPEWMQDASCTQTDPEIFFPDKSGTARPARKVCARCDVAAECLEWALRHNLDDGIYGGTTPSDRRKLARGGDVS